MTPQVFFELEIFNTAYCSLSHALSPSFPLSLSLSPSCSPSLSLPFRFSPSCFSFVGRVHFEVYYPQSGPQKGQPVKLSMSCNRGKIMHELGHALGFYHEHQRLDRDQYIEIHEENVLPGREDNFLMLPASEINGSEYDYGSIMHYPSNVFSRNGLDTITPKLDTINPNLVYEMGQRKRLSREDKKRANTLYQCIDNGGSIVL